MSVAQSLEPYKQRVDECSNVRINIDHNWDNLKALGTVFCQLYGVDMGTFMMIHRANYYGALNGEEDQKPALLKNMVERFNMTVQYLRALHIDQNLNRWLASVNMEVKTAPFTITFNTAWVDANINSLQEILGVNNVPRDPTALCRAILDATHALQADICVDADFIKITKAQEVEQLFEVEKPHFVQSVRIDANIKEGKSGEKKIKRMKKLSESAAKSVSIFA
jgi:hypothetical protein